MKPTVINNTTETPSQTHHDPSNVHSQPPNNGHANNDNARRFPQFRQHGFGFENPDDDVFADMGLRSRLNRMTNPFDWSARKRRGSGENRTDAYDHYFDDVDFPNFGSTWDAFGRVGNKRSQHPQEANDRSGFFNYVPQEFRQYVPEHFGGYFNGPRHDRHGQPYMQQQSPQPQQQQQHQPPPQQQQPPTQPQSSQPSGSKSNLCDAAIQTDDLGQPQNNGERRDGGNHPENDNRNGANTNRNASSASSSSTSTPYGNTVHMSTSTDGPGAHANASAGNNQNQYYQQSPNYAPQAPPYGTRNYQQPYGQQYYQYPQSHQPNQYYGNQATSPPPPPPQPTRQPQPTTQSPEGFVRNVPIVLEETGTPVPRAAAAATNVAAAASPPSSSNKVRPEPLNKDSFGQNQPTPSDQPIPCHPPPSHTQQTDQQHSVPSNADAAPPQTPHTADCISKIQAIQRDVLELMLAVEQFGGKRRDKDYMYLDEMLTRNLLKLDTIDTNGKESIRLARKEAIKCIQTSIAVLEAKADLNLNEKRDNVDQTSADQAVASNFDAKAPAADVKVANNMDIEEPTTDSSDPKTATEQNATDLTSDIPEVQKNVENISIEDKPSNDNNKQPASTEQQTKPEDKPATETGDAKN